MNKLMLGAAAVALTLAVSPAFAAEDSGVKLNLGGFFKGYANYTSEDTARHTDLLRDTEVHFGGETTLDNGLTVGMHIETMADGGDSFGVDESYVYFAGSWGRVNVGKEDGVAYLLQVAAPSADENIDGVRQTITPTNLGKLDYANDLARHADKLTYLSPVMSGFQVGGSYTPHDGTADSGPNRTNVNTGVSEAAVRYEGMVGNVGLVAGAGYQASTEADRKWNLGANAGIGAFGLGAVYTRENAGDEADSMIGADSNTWVLGVDYTTGPFKLGASYLNRNEQGDDNDTDRYTAGVVYTYGPGMTFRGSVAYRDDDSADDATTATVGTQINF